jgi:hypothetical protein
VLTSELADLYAMPKIASCEMAALAIGIARQTEPRVSTPEVRIRAIPSHMTPAYSHPAYLKQHQRPTPTA